MKSPPQFPTTAAAKIDPVTQFALSNFDNLPDDAFVSQPVLTGLGLGSRTTIWRGVKSARLPAPVKVSDRRVAWHVGAIRKHLANLAACGGAQWTPAQMKMPWLGGRAKASRATSKLPTFQT